MAAFAAAQETGSLRGHLTTIVEDLSGATIWLVGEGSSPRQYETKTAVDGTYEFAVPPGFYTLRVWVPGFKQLTIRSISISAGERKFLSSFQVDVGSICGENAETYLTYLRELPLGQPSALSGQVVTSSARSQREHAIVGAQISCSSGSGVETCGSTETDTDGRFRLAGLPPGAYLLQIRKQGFYEESSWLKVRDGFESAYGSLYLEQCATKNCGPKKRPKPPIRICE